MVDVLAEIPAGLADVLVTASRQAKVGNTAPRLSASVLAEMEEADQEERKVPSHLRSKHGRITLISTPSPVSYDAAELHDQGRTAVITWARHIAETRGVEIPLGAPSRRVVEHRALAGDAGELVEACTWSWSRNPVTIEAVCTWLIANLDAIRMDEAAGQMLSGLGALAASIERSVDRRPADVFAGNCNSTDTRVVVVPLVGAPCSGLICEHETCEQLRTKAHMLVPEVGECGQSLLAAEGDTEVECQSCGTVYSVADRRSEMADKLADHLGTVSEVAGFLRTLTLEINGETVPLEMSVDRINGWMARGRIASHGSDPNGRKLVLVGEIRDYAENWTRRRAARRKVTAA